MRLFFIFTMTLVLSSCFATKIVSTPLRFAGDIVSYVPVVGPVIDGVAKGAADAIDVIPL